MTNPLNKRFPRELKNNFGKYLGIFLMLVLVISFVSGFLVAASSILRISDGMYDEFNVEDGRFTTTFEISDATWKEIEGLGCTLYKNFSHDLPMELESDTQAHSGEDSTASTSQNMTVRVYQTRTDFDIGQLTEGSWPQGDAQIAIDRLFASNNGVKVGDTIVVDGRDLVVSGLCTNPDYTCLFEKNSDFLFNAVTFCVGVVDKPLFNDLGNKNVAYTYSFLFDERGMQVADRTSLEEDMADILSDNDSVVTDFIDHDANRGITYAAQDADGDSLMWEAMMFLLVAVMAFIFVILTSSTIDSESAVIGTLLASGYRKGELLRHYVTLPAFVGLVAAVVGNVLGYTLLIEPMRNLYYGSYSLPVFTAYWNTKVFIITTVIPYALLVGVTVIGLARKLNYTPLDFMRRETSKRKKGKGVVLPDKMPFASRFRIRVIMKNIPNFITLFAGIFLGGILLMLGFCLMPTIDNYASSLRKNLVAEYTYTLKAPLELDGTEEQREIYRAAMELADRQAVEDMSPLEILSAALKAQMINENANPVNTQANSQESIDQAEKYAVGSLQLKRAIGGEYEDVTVYGIQEDSKYWTEFDVRDGKVVFGRGLAEKCGSEVGVEQEFRDKYTNEHYYLKPTAINDRATDTSVYMSIAAFNELFGNDEDYFNGYVSNEPLEFDDLYLSNVLRPADMDKIGLQMRSSMGNIAQMMVLLAVLIYIVFMYLLTKTVIDGSARSISYMKVFGYRDREINKFYVRAITVCVAVSILLSLPLVIKGLEGLVYFAFMSYTGNFVLELRAIDLAKVVAMGVLSYCIVAFFHMRRIKRIPLAEALKTEG